jgi:hypothetical protein
MIPTSPQKSKKKFQMTLKSQLDLLKSLRKPMPKPGVAFTSKKKYKRERVDGLEDME